MENKEKQVKTTETKETKKLRGGKANKLQEKDVRARAKKMIAKYGTTYSFIAEKVGCTPTSVRNFVTGEVAISHKLLAKINTFLRVRGF